MLNSGHIAQSSLGSSCKRMSILIL